MECDLYIAAFGVRRKDSPNSEQKTPKLVRPIMHFAAYNEVKLHITIEL
jgi:hypothetical protein